MLTDQEIQIATASEPLTIDEEYQMQRSWRTDADKLTFITCLPPSQKPTGYIISQQYDSAGSMRGDVNLFLTREEDGNGVIGELELMIAKREYQGKGLGRATLLSFIHYVLSHQSEIIAQFNDTSTDRSIPPSQQPSTFLRLSAKVGQDNTRSFGLFTSVGFKKISEKPSYFGEWELWLEGAKKEHLEAMLQHFGVHGYQELEYRGAQ